MPIEIWKCEKCGYEVDIGDPMPPCTIGSKSHWLYPIDADEKERAELVEISKSLERKPGESDDELKKRIIDGLRTVANELKNALDSEKN